MKSHRVLVAPLDWGLGHAARCVPLIRELLAQGHQVVLAGSGLSLQLLKTEFPLLSFHELPGYDPYYSASNTQVWRMAKQLLKFARVIKQEHDVIDTIVKKERTTKIISDNRYGCWSADTENVFITHQLKILMPPSLAWLGMLVNRINRKYIQKFDQCWIPDWRDVDNFSGKLSSTEIGRVTFIGPLSRFATSVVNPVEYDYDILIALSGPEPQRGILEIKICSQLQQVNGKRIAVIRGTSESPALSYPAGILVLDFPPSSELQRLLESSAMIIARSGYSTLMDLAALRKKAIFIPTPGQTEQEYLAKRMKEKGIAYFATQKDFNIATALEQSAKYTGFTGDYSKGNRLRDVVTGLT